MAKHDVNFTQGGPITGDSGERGNTTPGVESIKPIADGERAISANLDRPPENLRKRTEVLRGEMEGQKYLQDSDMRWVLSSGKADGLHDFGPVPPKTEWPLIKEWQEWIGDPLNRWYFALEPSIAVVVQPLNTPSSDLQETKFWEFPNLVPGEGVYIGMLRRAYALANIREVVWEALPSAQIVGTHGTPLFLDLTLSGEDDHILTITIRDDDLTLIGHLTGAFAAWNVGYLLPAGFWGSTTAVVANNVRILDIPPGDEDYIFEGTADRELHYITAETFRDFFLASLDNLMSDGDTLAVMWESLVDPDPLLTDGRRQAIPANGNTEALVARLFLTSIHPEWIPLGIPLCKRLGKELLWLDGTVATEGMTQSIRFGENGYTVERVYSAPTTVPIAMTSKWYDIPAAPLWTTIMAALDGIVSDLAGTQLPLVNPVDPALGARLIGVPTTALAHPSVGFYNVPALGDDLKEVITQILTLLNAKSSLDLNETITGEWDHTVRLHCTAALLSNDAGVSGWGDGIGPGVYGEGGPTDGSGVLGVGGGAVAGVGVVGTGAVGGNGNGVAGMGTGTAAGVRGLGGLTDGAGIRGEGTAAGAGVEGVGGLVSGPGVSATGGGPNGTGVIAQGTGSGAGVSAEGGLTNGAGVKAQGVGTGPGVFATGGGTNGSGAYNVGGATNGIGTESQGTGTAAGVLGTGGVNNGEGVEGRGTGSGAGVKGYGGAAGAIGVIGYGVGTFQGVSGVGGAAEGRGGIFQGGGAGPYGAAIRVIPVTQDPTSPGEGDIWGDSANDELIAYFDGKKHQLLDTWATASITGGAAPVVPGQNNVASIVSVTAKATVTFDRAFSNANYAVAITLGGGDKYVARIVAKAAGAFEFDVWDLGVGGSVPLDAGTTTFTFDIIVKGVF